MARELFMCATQMYSSAQKTMMMMMMIITASAI
jgi:hypothetical protein